MKYILFAILAFICLPTYAQEKEGGNTITTFTGDEVTMSVVAARTINVKGKKNVTKVVDKPHPILLNGVEIYNHFWNKDKDTDEAVHTSEAQKKAVEEHRKYSAMIDDAIAEEKKLLPDGDYVYHLKNMVVSQTGQIVYFEANGLKRKKEGSYHPQTPVLLHVDGEAAKSIEKKILSMLYKFQFTPLTLDGVATPYASGFSHYFTISE